LPITLSVQFPRKNLTYSQLEEYLQSFNIIETYDANLSNIGAIQDIIKGELARNPKIVDGKIIIQKEETVYDYDYAPFAEKASLIFVDNQVVLNFNIYAGGPGLYAFVVDGLIRHLEDALSVTFTPDSVSDSTGYFENRDYPSLQAYFSSRFREDAVSILNAKKESPGTFRSIDAYEYFIPEANGHLAYSKLGYAR
jgi:hypothetical protein